MNDELLTIQEAADFLGVSTKTLRRWEARGVLVAARTVGNQRRYTRQELQEFKAKPKPVFTPAFLAAEEPEIVSPVEAAPQIPVQQTPVEPIIASFAPNNSQTPPTSVNPPLFSITPPSSEISKDDQIIPQHFQAPPASDVQVSPSHVQDRVQVSDGFPPRKNFMSYAPYALAGIIIFAGLLLATSFGSIKQASTLTLGKDSSGIQWDTQSVLAVQAKGRELFGEIEFFIPAIFNQKVTINKDFVVNGKSLFNEDIKVNNKNLDLGTGELTASNVVYGLTAGANITISGDPQNPTIAADLSDVGGVTSVQGQTGALTLVEGTGISLDGLEISNTGVLSLGGQTGEVSLTAGDGIAVSGTTITNDDPGSAQNIFKKVLVNATEIIAGSNSDTLTITAGSGITITPDASAKSFTISGSNSSQWTTTGSDIYYATGNVGIGNTAPTSTLDVTGSATISGSLGIGNLGEGIVRANSSGLLSSSALNLSGGGTEITGILPVGNGGTGISTTPASGQLLIGNGTNYDLANLTGTLNQVSINNAPGSITFSLPQDIHTGATPTFAGLAIPTDTNQITLGTGNTATLTMETLTNNRTITLPDASGVVCLSSGNCGAGGGGGTIVGSGTTNYLVKFTSSTGISDSLLYEAGGKIALGNTSPQGLFNVSGAPTGQALVVLNYTGSGENILVGSSSGTTRFAFDATGNLNLLTGGYQVAGTEVLNGTTLGTGVTTSSLTTVGALNSGSITSGFGNIDVGTDSISGGDITSTNGVGFTSTGNGADLTFSGMSNHDITASSGTLRLGAVTLLGAVTGNSQNITGLNNLSATGTITFSGLSTGIVQSDSSGVLSSAALNLASGASYITGTLPVTNGGTGLSSVTTGDLIYASGSNTLAALPIGSSGYVLTVSGGVPTWSSSSSLNYLQRNNGALSPINITDDFLIGGTSTSSATFQIVSGTGNASTSGNLTFNSAGTVQSTNNQTLTFGGNTTGNIILSPLSGNGSVLSTGDLNLSSGKAYQINGTSVLSSTTLGSGVLNSSLTSVGALATGSIATGFGSITTANNITGADVNATGNIRTGAGAGTIRISDSGNLVNIGSTQLNSVTYTWPGADGSGDYVLTTNGSGTLSWSQVTSLAGAGDITAIGDVTSGAAFTAAGTQGTSLYFYDADGRGQLTIANLTGAQTYTLPDESGTVCLTSGNCVGVGGSLGGSGTSGQIAYFTGAGTVESESSGFAWDATNNKLGIGTDSPTGKMTVSGASTGKALVVLNETGDQQILAASASGTTMFVLDRSGNLSFEGQLSDITQNEVTVNDGLNLTTGNVYQINGTNVLTSNTLGAGILSSSLTTVGALSTGSISNGFGSIVTSNAIEGSSLTANGNGSGLTFSGTGNHDITASGGTLRLGAVTLNGAVSGNAQSITGLNALSASGTITFGTFSSNGGILYTNGSGQLVQVAAGTSTQVLKGGTTPSFGAVDLTTDVTGVLPIANGGTNANTIGSAGSVPYSNGTSYAFSSVGQSGQVLVSGGSGSPTWTDAAGVGTNYWQRSNGAVAPLEVTNDLLVGGSSTSSALFKISGMTGSATTAGNLTFNTASSVQTTDNQTLTFGGNTTGDIMFTPRNGSGMVTTNGNFNLATGNVFRINNTDVLSATALGNNVVGSQLTQVGALANGSITTGFGTIVTSNTISGTVLNASTGVNTSNTQRIDSSGNLANIGTIDSTYLDTSTNIVNLAASTALQFNGTTVINSSRQLSNIAGISTSLTPTAANTYALGTGTGNQYSSIYGQTIYQNGNQVCDSSANCAGQSINYWDLANGTLAPKIATLDLLVGGISTQSAKFAVLNIAGGTPTASVSAGDTGGAYMTAAGTIGTSTMQTLTLGSNTTGNIVIDSGTGNITLSDNVDATSGLDVTGANLTVGGSNATITTTGVITGTTINATTALQTSGNTRIDSSGNLMNIATIDSSYLDTSTNLVNLAASTDLQFNGTTVINSSRQLANVAGISTSMTPTAANTYSLGTAVGNQYANVYSQAIYQNGNQVCDSSGNCAGQSINYWDLANGTLAPKIATLDLLVGGISTQSAKFAVLNMGPDAGSPTASLSGTTGGTYMTAAGTLQTTNNQTLTIGGGTTGNILLNPLNSNGTVGIGTSVLSTLPGFSGNLVTKGVIQSGVVNSSGQVLMAPGDSNSGRIIWYDQSGNSLANLGYSTSGLPLTLTNGAFTVNGGSVGVGTLSTLATLDIRGNSFLTPVASISGSSGKAALVVDQTNIGDIFTASSSGLNRFVIKQNGNVGIGTASPTDKLHVAGNIKVTTDDGGGYYIQSTNTGVAERMFGLANSGQDIHLMPDWSGDGTSGVVHIGYNMDATNRYIGLGYGTAASNYTTVKTATNTYLAELAGSVGIGTTSPLAKLDVRGLSGTAPVASVSGATTNSALIVDQSGSGDLFTASKSGATKFVVKNSGFVGIGTNNPSNLLTIKPTISGQDALVVTESDSNTSAVSFRSYDNGGQFIMYGDGNQTLLLNGANTSFFSNGLTVGLAPGSTSLAGLDIRGATPTNGLIGTQPIASFSGQTSQASVVIDQSGIGELFTASKSGATKFKIDNGGNVTINNLVNCTALETNGSGLITCGSDDAGVAGTNYWQLNNGALTPFSTTADLLLGATSTQSAKFAFINNFGSGTPTASIAGSATNNALYLTGDGTIATTNNQSLTLGASDTGDVVVVGDRYRFTNLANCNTIDSDANGVLTCGTDAGGAGAAGTINVQSNGSPVGSNVDTLNFSTLFNVSASPATTAQISLAADALNFTEFSDTLSLDAATSIATGNVDFTLGTNAGTGGILIAPNAGGKSALIINKQGAGDIFSASASGTTRLTLSNTGNLNLIGGVYQLGGVNGITQSTGSCVTTTGGIVTGASACEFGLDTWTGNSSLGIVHSSNTTMDVLIGGTSSSSAKFAFLNNASGTPTASVSAGAAGGIYLSAAGKLATTARHTLTLGDSSTTGNVFIDVDGSSGNLGIGTAAPSRFVGIVANQPNGLMQIQNTNASSYSSIDFFNNSGTLQGNIGYANASAGNFTNVFYMNTSTAIPLVFGINTTERMRLDTEGKLGIGTNSSLATLDVRGQSGTLPVASFSGQTARAGLLVDNTGVGDLFTASKSGASKFTVLNSGNVRINNLNSANCDVKADTTGLLSCGTDDGGTNYWQLNSGTIAPGNGANAADRLVLGGNSTTTHQFEVNGKQTGKALVSLNETGDQNILTASASGTTVFTLDRSGNIALEGQLSDLSGNTLVINDDLQVTGNDILDSGSTGRISLGSTTTLTNTTLSLSGTTSITGGATAIDFTEFDVAAGTGSITINDNTDAGQISIESTVLDINSLDFTGAGTLTASGADLTLNPGGGDVYLADGDRFVVGGHAGGVAYNVISDSGGAPASGQINSDDDLYVEGTIEAAALYQGANQVCDTSGNCAGTTNYLQLNSGTLAPGNAATANSRFVLGGNSTTTHQFEVNGKQTGKALVNLNETGDQNILTASASGTTVFTLDRSGNIAMEGQLSDLSGNTLVVNDDLQVSGNDILSSGGTTALSLSAADVTVAGDLTVSGGDIVGVATTNLINTGTTTLNFAGAATTLNIADAAITGTIDIGGVTNNGATTVNIATNGTSADTISIGNSNASTTMALTGGDDWSLSAAGVLTLDGTTMDIDSLDFVGAGTITASGADITLNPGGGDVYLADGDRFVVGGHAGGVAYNVIANSGEAPEQSGIDADNDLYIGGSLEVDGTIYQGDNQVCDTSGNCAGGAGGSKWQLTSNNIAPLTATDRVVLGGNTTTPFQFEVNGKQTGKALVSLNETGDQNILTASASGTTVLTLDRSGNLTFEGQLADLSGNTVVVNDDLQVTGNDILSSGGTTALTLSAADVTVAGDMTVSGGDIIGTATTNLLNTGTTTLNFAGAATTLNVADAAITGTIDIGGVTNNGATTVNIATNGTSADTIAIGNSNGSTTLALTGGDDWNLAATGVFTLSASATQTTALVITDTDYTNSLSVGDNNIIGTTADLNFTNFDVTGSTGDTTIGGDLTVSGGDITGATTTNLLNTSTTVNLADAAITGTIDIGGVTADGTSTVNIATNGTSADALSFGNSNASTTFALTGGDDWSLSAAGVLTLDGTTMDIDSLDFVGAGTITASGADITLNPGGGDVYLADGDRFVVGGHAGGVAYNVISDSGGAPASGQINSDDDLYVEGTIEAAALYQGANQVCDTSGNCAGLATNYWDQSNGTLSAKNTTVDFLVGGISTQSAKFAVVNVNSGTPTASVSAGTSGAAFINASGNIQTTARQSLTLGGGATGNIVLSGFGAGALQTNSAGVVTTGTLSVGNGGTGATSFTSGGVLYGNSSSAIGASAQGTAGQALVSGGSGAPTWTTGTLTLAGNFATSGSNALTLTTTGSTNVTLPTTGTLATLAGTETLSSKTLTAPRFADLGFIADSSGNELLIFDSVASAVNEITIGNATTTNAVTLAATGGDTNIPLAIDAKGSGELRLNGTGTGNILLGGGSSSTGCTVTNSNGNFACSGTINGATINSGASLSGTNTGDQTITLTGDVTGSGTSSFATTIADNAVDGTDISLTSEAQGNVMYFDGTDWVRLANGTSNQVLHSGTTPSWSAVSLTADVSGTLPIASGGTNSTATPTNGGIAYGTGTAYAFTSAGSAGECLTSNGAAAPTWGACGASSTNYWDLNNGALSAKNSTVDLLMGGVSSQSAKFAVLNMNSGTPTASISAQSGTNPALVLSGDGSIQSVRRQTLTLGGSTTGNISLLPNNGTGGRVNVSGNMNLLTGNSYQINGTDVLSAGTLGSTITVSSLDAVDQLNAGSITSGFGSIDVGSDSITGGDITSGGASGFIANQSGADLSFTGGGTNIISSTGTLQINAFTLGGTVTGGGNTVSNLGLLTVDQLQLNGGTLDTTSGDLTLGASGGDIIFSSGTTLNIGGNGSDVAFNAIGQNLSTANQSWLANGSNGPSALYVQGRLEVDGAINNIDVQGQSGTTPAASVSARTSFATMVVNNDGVGDLFTASKSGKTHFTIRNSGTVVIGNSTNGITFDPVNGGMSSSGTARQTKTISLHPEYSGAILSAFNGSATDSSINGFMTSDIETSSTNSLRTYYQWTSTQASLNYYTVAVRVKLPKDFSAWTTSNALQVDFTSSSTSTANNVLDVRVYLESNSTTAVATDLTNAAAVANTWETVTIDDSTLDDGSAPEWDAADETAVIFLRMGSLSSNTVRIGEIRLNYLSSF